MSALSESAIAYAQTEGLYVFPLKVHGKVPLTPHGLDDATTDALTIETWWDRWPDANIAIRTGDLVVVDEDQPGALAELAAQLGEQIPRTRIVRTGKGRHYYFTQPNGQRIRNTAGKLAPGIDTRGDGGYVVAPPSVHPDGGIYAWESTAEPMPFPDWMVRLLLKPETKREPFLGRSTPYGQRALEAEVHAVAVAGEGTRNDTLNTAAFSLGQLIAGGELDEHDARASLQAAARACGLAEKEAGLTIESGLSAGLAEPRQAPETNAPQPRTERAGEQPSSLEEWEPLKAVMFLELPEPAGVELLGPLVLRGGRTLIGGDSGHGKTTLAFAMVAAIISGEALLGHTGVGQGPALIIDLEQGVRSIKRGIRDAGLDDTDTYILNLPDGLALDQSPAELKLLEHVIADLKPVAIVLDPYYKAHRGDANEERAVTDLMRNLDRLRTEYLFALILPAHVRKEQQLAKEVRKLTLADIAGSGALSRGAEIVLGLERLSHGHARLRYLKDREGELPVGDAVDLTYSQEEGFAIKEAPSTVSIEGSILGVEESGWLTTREWAKATGFQHAETKRVLERLAATDQIRFEIGPQGRSARSKCYSTTTVPRISEQSGTVGTPKAVGDGFSTVPNPPPIGGGNRGTPTASAATVPEHQNTDDDIPW